MYVLISKIEYYFPVLCNIEVDLNTFWWYENMKRYCTFANKKPSELFTDREPL